MTDSRIDINVDAILQHAISRKLACVFEAAAKSGMDLCSFTEAFLSSGTGSRVIIDHSVYSQSPWYILGLFDEEGYPPIDKAKYQEDDIAYWFGYLFGEWCQTEDIQMSDLLQYDISKIWSEYEMMHTQDIRYAIDRIKEDAAKDR